MTRTLDTNLLRQSMTRTIEQEVIQTIADIKGISKQRVNPNSYLGLSLDFNTLDRLNLALALEEKFPMTPEECNWPRGRAINSCRTVRNVIQYVTDPKKYMNHPSRRGLQYPLKK